MAGPANAQGQGEGLTLQTGCRAWRQAGMCHLPQEGLFLAGASVLDSWWLRRGPEAASAPLLPGFAKKTVPFLIPEQGPRLRVTAGGVARLRTPAGCRAHPDQAAKDPVVSGKGVLSSL